MLPRVSAPAGLEQIEAAGRAVRVAARERALGRARLRAQAPAVGCRAARRAHRQPGPGTKVGAGGAGARDGEGVCRPRGSGGGARVSLLAGQAQQLATRYDQSPGSGRLRAARVSSGAASTGCWEVVEDEQDRLDADVLCQPVLLHREPARRSPSASSRCEAAASDNQQTPCGNAVATPGRVHREAGLAGAAGTGERGRAASPSRGVSSRSSSSRLRGQERRRGDRQVGPVQAGLSGRKSTITELEHALGRGRS